MSDARQRFFDFMSRINPLTIVFLMCVGFSLILTYLVPGGAFERQAVMVIDIHLADVLLVTGSNTTEAHPVISLEMKNAIRKRGAKLILIDPREIELASFATLHLRPRSGTDVALLNTLAHIIIVHGWAKEDFITARTENFDALKEAVKDCTPQWGEDITGVPAEMIIEAAQMDRASTAVIIRRIILPLIKGTILMAALLRAMEAFREFPKMYGMTGGGPGRATEASSMLIYKTAFRFFEMGYASAMTIVMLLLLVAAYGFYLRVAQRVSDEY